MVLCRDCKSLSQVESFIRVDPLHVQCPLCLYVFFMDGGKGTTSQDRIKV